nr:sodium-independent sulfate anion transporter-like isoform X2 [Onthophagus taurus]
MRKYKMTNLNEPIKQNQVILTAFTTDNDENAVNNTTQDNSPNHYQTNTSNQINLKKLVLKRIPILQWLPKYNKQFALCDLVAGITIGLTVIPQGIAYSNVVGLPAQIGLYSSFMACFVYVIFGSCKVSPIGPTAIATILTRENLNGLGLDGAVLLCFLSGCIELLMGILQLGFLIDFISGPVSTGFTSAAAIIIATSQIKDLLGIRISSGKFIEVWKAVFNQISETNIYDAILGVSCILTILTCRKLKDIKIGPKDISQQKLIHSITKKSLWFLYISINIILVFLTSLMAYIFEKNDMKPFTLTGPVASGLPSLSVPNFSTTINNNQTLNFFEMSSKLGTGLIVVPLISILENIALAKVFSEGQPVDATQEMLALGLCNIASSFVSSIPVTGGLARGAVNYACEVKTTFGGIYTGVLVILSLIVLTPYFEFIPKPTLAALIVSAVIFMVELHVFKPIWKTKKIDLIPAVATFLTCLFVSLELGILVGILINVVFLLYASARPKILIKKLSTKLGNEYVFITPDRTLSFPSIEYVRSIVVKAGRKEENKPVVVDAKHIHAADFTTAKVFKSLLDDFSKRNQPIFFINIKPSVLHTLEGVKPQNLVCFDTIDEARDVIDKHNVQDFIKPH